LSVLYVTPPGRLIYYLSMGLCVSVTMNNRRGSCGFCQSFVTARAHRRWWRVSSVTQQVKAWRQNCHCRNYTRLHIWL